MEVGNFNKLLFCVIFLVIFSCSPQKGGEQMTSSNDEKIDEFTKVYPLLSNYEWSIHSEFESEDNSYFEMELDGQSGDTSVVIALMKSVTTRDRDMLTSYFISRFIKTFQKKNATHQIRTINGRDILYHYYYSGEIDEPENRIFIEGKYKYLYNLGILDSLQRKYYLQHTDSLDGIMGDDLPQLPQAMN